MADLSTIELNIVARDSGMDQAVQTVTRLENRLLAAVKALDSGTISQKRFDQVMQASVQTYSKYAGNVGIATINTSRFVHEAKKRLEVEKQEIAVQQQLDAAEKRRLASEKEALEVQRKLEKALKAKQAEEKKETQELQRQKKAFDSLRQSIDPVYKAKQRTTLVTKQLRAAVARGDITRKEAIRTLQLYRKQLEATNTVQMAATKANNRMGVVAQQAGYQVSDFIVQVQSGQSVFIAFSQQASQLVGVLPLVADRLGMSAGRAIALSAGLGIAIPLITSAAMVLFNLGRNSEDAASSLDKASEELEEFKSLSEEIADVDLDEEFGNFTEGVIELKSILAELNLEASKENFAKSLSESITTAIPDIENLNLRLAQAIDSINPIQQLWYALNDLTGATLPKTEFEGDPGGITKILGLGKEELGPIKDLIQDIPELAFEGDVEAVQNKIKGLYDYIDQANGELTAEGLVWFTKLSKGSEGLARVYAEINGSAQAARDASEAAKVTDDQRVEAANKVNAAKNRLIDAEKTYGDLSDEAKSAALDLAQAELERSNLGKTISEGLRQQQQEIAKNNVESQFSADIQKAINTENEKQDAFITRYTQKYSVLAKAQEAGSNNVKEATRRSREELELFNGALAAGIEPSSQQYLLLQKSLRSYQMMRSRAEELANVDKVRKDTTAALLKETLGVREEEVKLLYAKGETSEADKLAIKLAGDRAFHAAMAKASTEEEAGAIAETARKAREAAERAEELSQQTRDANEHAKELESSAKEIAKAFEKAVKGVANFGYNLEEKLVKVKAENEAIKKGLDDQVAGELAVLDVKIKRFAAELALANVTEERIGWEVAHLKAMAQAYGEELTLNNLLNDSSKKKIKNIQDTIDELEDEVKLERKMLGLSKQRQREEEIYAELVKENKDAQKQLSNDVLRAKAEEIAAAEAANEVYQKGIDFAMEMSNTFADFIVNGFKDFKSFVSSIGDMFKQLLAQMVAQALQTKIFLPITTVFLGGAGNAAAQSALGNVAGSAIGGSAGGGFLGSIAGAAGGFLGGVGTGLQASLGLGGFASQGLFNVSANAAVATAAGASPIAASIGAALPVLGAVAVVVGLFTKKVKELDNGLRVTIDGTETLVESYRRLKTTRLFGLISSKSTEYEEAPSETADPIIQAVAEIQDSVVNMATGIGIGADAFNDFAYQFKVSLKGLSEEEAIAALQKEFEGVTEAMAELVPDLSSFSREGESLSQTLSRLYTDLSVVNNTFGLLGRSALDASMDMAAAASDLIAAAGGVNAYISKTQTLVDTLYDTQEQLDVYTNALGDTFGGTVPTKEEVKGILESGTLEELETLYGADTISTLTKIYDLQNQIAQEELARAEEAQRIADAAAEEAQRIADAAERERQRAEAEAQRERERAAAEAEAERQRVLNERLNLETRILQLQGNTAELRRRELAALDPSNRALQEMIYKLEDAKKAMDDLNEEDFATLVDYQRAMARAAAEMNSVSIPTGGTGVSNPAMPITLPEERNDWRGRDPRGERERDRERRDRRERRQEQFEADMMTGMAALNKQAKRTADSLRKFDVDGLPAERT